MLGFLGNASTLPGILNRRRYPFVQPYSRDDGPFLDEHYWEKGSMERGIAWEDVETRRRNACAVRELLKCRGTWMWSLVFRYCSIGLDSFRLRVDSVNGRSDSCFVIVLNYFLPRPSLCNHSSRVRCRGFAII